MNIEEVSLEQYLNFSDKEKFEFYQKIIQQMSFYRHNLNCIYEKKVRERKTSAMKQLGAHQKNGRLTFIDELQRKDIKDKKIYYLCVCDCGNWHICRSDAFSKENTSGGCFSCGCLNKESYKKILHDETIQKKRIENLKEYLSTKGIQVGDNINGWIITQTKIDEIITNDNNRKRKYAKGICPYCKLESQWIRADGIQNKTVISCGCASESRGEKVIRELLEKANIPFVQEATFPNCVSKKNGTLRFDFYVNNEYLIEFDGEQHFSPTGSRFTQTVVEEIQERDFLKNQYCKENSISLIRIPYTHLENIQLEDICLNTSKFILKGEANE